MKMKLVRPLFLGLIFLCIASNLSAKSEAVDSGYYTTKEQEFYLTSNEIYFIRPGLNVEILEVEIPGDLSPLVTFSIKDPGGLPLDINGVFTPGPVDMRFMLTFIPQLEEQKVRLTESTRDRDGTFESLGDGVYTYKFSTILPDIYDPDATHTLAAVGRRDLQEFDLDRYVDNEVLHFVPSGMFDPMPRDVVTTETCNGRCHDPLAMHGGRYVDINVCTQCHNPGLLGRNDGLSKSFNVLIHKKHNELEEGYPAILNDCETCHTGGTPTQNFPMVANPAAALVCDDSGRGETTLTWQHAAGVEIQVRSTANLEGKVFARGGKTGSVATGKWVKDGMFFDLYDRESMELLQTVPVNATVLGCIGNAPGSFRGEAGAQHSNWLDHPSRLVCGSCHTDVDFETGEGHSDSNFVQLDDQNCGNCHKPGSGNEFDRSIRGAHKPLYKSVQLPGVLVDIIDVTNTNPGDKPTVKFTLGSKNGKLNPVSLDRFRLEINGPNEDFSFQAQETVGNAAVNAGDYWTYTFNTPLPSDAQGSYSIGFSARNNVTVDIGGEESIERDYAQITTFAFAVTDAEAVPRRMVVDDANCENCHTNLSKHGGNYNNPNYCITCHRPERLSLGEPPTTIHFKYMIHKIHRGADLENGFVVNRSRDRVADFSDVAFPGDLRNCENCHVNDSQQLSLPPDLLPTSTPTALWDPTMPVAAACLSCHDSDAAASHAYSNTSFFGESCATCHGEGKDFSVDKVHAH